MITFVIFSVKRAFQGLWRNRLMSLAATATMVLMLLLLSGFWIIQTGLLAGLDFTEQKVEVVADLYDDAPAAQIDAVRQQILETPEVATVTLVTKDEALAAIPRPARGAGRRGPDPLPRCEPAAPEPRDQAEGSERLRRRRGPASG